MRTLGATSACAGPEATTFVVHDIYVPAHRTLSMDDFREGTTPGSRVNTGPLYRGAMICTFPHALSGAGAWRRTRRFRRLAGMDPRENVATSTGEAVSDWPHVQMRIAQTEADLDAAELLLRRNLDVIRDGGPGRRARTRSFCRLRPCGAYDLSRAVDICSK